MCASEDSHVYLWRTTRVAPAPAIGIGIKPKTWCTIRSYENFYCKDVSAAVPWAHAPSPPGSPAAGSPQGIVCNEESCSVAAKPEGGDPAEPNKQQQGGALLVRRHPSAARRERPSVMGRQRCSRRAKS